MPDPVTGLIAGGTSLVGGVLSGKEESKAAGRASAAQTQAAQAGISEERIQFEKMQELLSPYVEAGTGALQAQQELIGLGGAEQQQAAISQLEGSPLFQSLVGQGEQGLLQQASATGGLRGGDIQGALAQFRPAMLQQVIESQYGKLGGLAGMGQASATGVGAAGQQTGANIANLLAQAGQAQAAGALGKGQARAGMYGGISDLITTGAILASKGGFGGGGGTGAIGSGGGGTGGLIMGGGF